MARCVRASVWEEASSTNLTVLIKPSRFFPAQQTVTIMSSKHQHRLHVIPLFVVWKQTVQGSNNVDEKCRLGAFFPRRFLSIFKFPYSDLVSRFPICCPNIRNELVPIFSVPEVSKFAKFPNFALGHKSRFNRLRIWKFGNLEAK